MTEPNRFDRLKDAFHALSELPSEERAAALERAAGGDAAFAEELRSLLAAAEAETSRLEVPIARIFEPAQEGPPEGRPPHHEIQETIPGYRLLEPIGRGGSSVVYLAEQLGDGFTRRVALKIIDARVGGAGEPDANADRARRVRDEQRILATLEHPGIARLYDAGVTPSGQPYLAMEWVLGDNLLDACRRRNLTIPERLRLFRSVLDAVEYAHRAQVVHRDLKPANILVSERGEAKLLDFGIARIAEQGADATQTRHRAMTPAYASPEQVSGGVVDVRSDLYSLGVVLYELLTDRRPYRISDSSFDTLERAIREQEPERPSTAVTREDEATDETSPRPRERLRRELRGDLDAIVLKALRKDPAARYASATEFSADLERHLEGRPVLARRGTIAYHLSQAVRRHRGLLVNAGLIGLLGLGGWLWLERQEAKANLREVDPKGSIWRAFPVAESAAADYRDGLAATERGDFSTAKRKFETAVRAEPNNALLHAALAHASFLGDAKPSGRGEAQFALTLADSLPQEVRLLVEAVAQRGLGKNERAAELLRSLWLLRPRDLDVGMLFAESLSWSGSVAEALEVLAKLRAQPDTKGMAALRVGQLEVGILGQSGRPKDVMERVPALVQLARGAKLPELEARLLSDQSYAQSGLGQTVPARASAERALRLFRANGERRGAAHAENLLCVVTIREARYDEAEQLCRRALLDNRRVGDLSTAARVLSNLSVTYRRRGLLREARAGYAEALTLERSAFGNPIALARILHNISNVEVELGELHAAEAHLRDAIAVLRTSDNQLSLFHSLTSLAVVLRNLGSVDEAAALLTEAAPIAEKVAPPSDLAALYFQQGDLWRSIGDDPQAAAFYGKAAQLLEGTDDDLVVNVDFARRSLEVATPFVCRELERGQRRLEALEDNGAVQAAIVVARCWIDAQDPATAARWIADAAPRAQAAGHVEDLRDLALARAYLGLAQGHLAEAEAAIREADANCREHGYAEPQLEVRLLEVRLALERGDHPERVRVLAEELLRDARSERFGGIAKKAEQLLRSKRLASR